MSDHVILLTEQERQEVRDFTMKAYVLSEWPPNPLAIIEDNVILLGLDVVYPRNDGIGDRAYFVEIAFNEGTDRDMMFDVWREILRVSEERWAELKAENE